MGKFLNQMAMSEIRHGTDVTNSRAKRGDYDRPAHTAIVICGCDYGGCHFEADFGKHLEPKTPPPAPQPRRR